MGYQANASNSYATAIGYQAIASATNSFSFGYYSEAAGDNSFAIGTYGLNGDGTVNTGRPTKNISIVLCRNGYGRTIEPER